MFCWKAEAKIPLENLRIDGTLILKLTLRKRIGKYEVDSSGWG
jgi:hypothetical protein